ncbi:MAG: Nramp family divalent metal transporter [Candidatus Latescibacteria bacterium]|nr:Nramp family divalent metal transporter [Candidatus Latescibacterota bacterium]
MTPDEQKQRFPELAPELSSRRVMDFLKFFGPGAVIASVTIGSGETVWASRSGAIFGYAMFWAFSLFCLTKGVQVYTAARYMTLTGEHPMERWAALPGPRGLFPGIIGVVVIVAFPFYLASLPIMLGTITSWVLFGDPGLYPHAIAILFIVLLAALTLMQSYGFLERVQLTLVGSMLVVMLIATFAVNPDWMSVLAGAITPSLPDYPQWVKANPAFADRTLIVEMVAYMGVMGGGVQDYVGYVGMMREKAWGLIGRVTDGSRRPAPAEDERNVRLGLRWLKAPLIDCTVSFGSVLVFTATFLILGATLLHTNRIVPSGMDLYNYQVVFLTQLHPGQTAQILLSALYKAGVFFAIFGTVYGAFELYVRTAHECVRSTRLQWRNLTLDRMRLWTLCYSGVAAIGLVTYAWWTATLDPRGVGWNPISMMTIPLHITGVLLAGPWCFAMVWADRRFLPEPFRMGPLLVTLNMLCGIVFTAFGVLAVIEDFKPFFQ